MVNMLMNVELPLIVWKDKPTMLKRKIKNMYGFQNMLVELDELENDHVTFRYASKILVKDKDKILIHLKN